MMNDSVPHINSYQKDGLEFIEVTNHVGMKVTFTNFGASIYSIEYLGKHMTYQAKNVSDFLKESIYNGKTIGRVAGRIPGSTIKIDGTTYQLSANEGENVLHGGHEGLSTKTFSCRVFATTEHFHVVYTYFSTKLESGFPGNALFEVHYIVSDNKAKLKVKLLSYVTEKSPISLTNHIYFALGDENINNSLLKINSSKYLKMNPKDLLFNEAIKVPYYLDFTQKKSVIKDIDVKEMNQGKLKGYDHIFILDSKNEEIPQIIMENDEFGVNIFTDFDSVVVYTDNFDPNFEADSSTERCRRGIAIEPQLNPSKPRLLSVGEEFNYFIRYEFYKR